MRRIAWLQILIGGGMWAAVYNAAWGLAWVGFMRREWAQPARSTGESMPWTTDFWMIWIPLTVPFGVAIAAYLSAEPQRLRLLQASLAASFVMWVPGALGMAFSMALTTRVIVVDSAVNIFAVLLASSTVAWFVRRRDEEVARKHCQAAAQHGIAAVGKGLCRRVG